MLFITGDTHGDPITTLERKNFPISSILTKKDLVIIAGDFGVLWEGKENKKEKEILDWLDKAPFTTCFIGGNHENWDRLGALELSQKYNAMLGQVSETVYFIPNGTVITHEDKNIWCFGGADSIDKHRRVEGISWWEQEIPSRIEMEGGVASAEKYKDKIHYVVTHTMPKTVIYRYLTYRGLSHFVTDPVPSYLEFIWKHCITNFDRWFCGHFHDEWKYSNFYLIYKKILEASTGGFVDSIKFSEVKLGECKRIAKAKRAEIK